MVAKLNQRNNVRTLVQTLVTPGYLKLLKILFLLFLSLGTPIGSISAEMQTLEIEFSFTASNDSPKQLLGYRLYKDGEQVCDSYDHYTNKITCDIFTEDGIFNFTLVAYFFDGTESLPSPSFPFVIGPIYKYNPTLAHEIQELYFGYLGRAADLKGLNYWGNEIISGRMTMEQLRANLTNEQPEYTNIYGGLTRWQLASQIYRNLFEREPDADGLEYWVNGGGSIVDAEQLIVAFLNAASTADQLVLDNKITEAMNYMETN